MYYTFKFSIDIINKKQMEKEMKISRRAKRLMSCDLINTIVSLFGATFLQHIFCKFQMNTILYNCLCSIRN